MRLPLCGVASSHPHTPPQVLQTLPLTFPPPMRTCCSATAPVSQSLCGRSWRASSTPSTGSGGVRRTRTASPTPQVAAAPAAVIAPATATAPARTCHTTTSPTPWTSAAHQVRRGVHSCYCCWLRQGMRMPHTRQAEGLLECRGVDGSRPAVGVMHESAVRMRCARHLCTRSYSRPRPHARLQAWRPWSWRAVGSAAPALNQTHAPCRAHTMPLRWAPLLAGCTGLSWACATQGCPCCALLAPTASNLPWRLVGLSSCAAAWWLLLCHMSLLQQGPRSQPAAAALRPPLCRRPPHLAGAGCVSAAAGCAARAPARGLC